MDSQPLGTLGELQQAMRDALEHNGGIDRLKAHVRSEVYQALSSTRESYPPQPSSENLLLNELIREYLVYNGYRDTLSIFMTETGQPQARPFTRAFMSQQLKIEEHKQLPLLYSLAYHKRPPADTSKQLIPPASKEDTAASQ